jgi:hypothetical protein
MLFNPLLRRQRLVLHQNAVNILVARFPKILQNFAWNLAGGIFGPERGILDALERLVSDAREVS